MELRRSSMGQQNLGSRTPFFSFLGTALFLTIRRTAALSVTMLRPTLSSSSSSSLSNAPSTDTTHSNADSRHLVLVGGGHGHVQVIKALRNRPSNLRVTLLDATDAASYSGMVPGCIADAYTPEQTLLRLRPLAEWAGIDFRQEKVVDVDFERKLLYTDQPDSDALSFDVLSLDIGSTSRDWQDVPGAAEFTIPTRPIDQLVRRLDAALDGVRARVASVDDDNNNNNTAPPKLVVVGGGAAGIELSMAITTRWKHFTPNVDCTVLDAGSQLVPHESPTARRKLQSILRDKHITVRHDCHVDHVTADAVVLTSGDRIPFTCCVWATGAGAHTLARTTLAQRGLEVDKYGWIRVHPTLQSTSHDFVFAAGDCNTIVGLPEDQPSPPKAGVYAVRSGPVLIENLMRYSYPADRASALVPYTPQDDFLKLLVCGDHQAMGFRFGLALYGSWVFRMKDQIDRNFMKLFDVAHLPTRDDTTGSDAAASPTRQYDDSDDDDDNESKKEKVRLSAMDAAALLRRTDDDVDFQVAQSVLRRMAADDSYRRDVLAHAAEHETIESPVHG
jgi:selenide,water dikinase